MVSHRPIVLNRLHAHRHHLVCTHAPSPFSQRDKACPGLKPTALSWLICPHMGSSIISSLPASRTELASRCGVVVGKVVATTQVPLILFRWFDSKRRKRKVTIRLLFLEALIQISSYKYLVLPNNQIVRPAWRACQPAPKGRILKHAFNVLRQFSRWSSPSLPVLFADDLDLPGL